MREAKTTVQFKTIEPLSLALTSLAGQRLLCATIRQILYINTVTTAKRLMFISFFCSGTTISKDKSTHQREIFILAHDFRFQSMVFGPVSLSLWWHSISWQDHVMEEICSPLGGQKAKGEEGIGAPKSPSRAHTQ